MVLATVIQTQIVFMSCVCIARTSSIIRVIIFITGSELVTAFLVNKSLQIVYVFFIIFFVY